jgi:hypothetical protein
MVHAPQVGAAQEQEPLAQVASGHSELVVQAVTQSPCAGSQWPLAHWESVLHALQAASVELAQLQTSLGPPSGSGRQACPPHSVAVAQ